MPDKAFQSTVLALTICGHVPKNFEKSTIRWFILHNIISKGFFLFTNCVAPILHIVLAVRKKSDFHISEDVAFFLAGFSVLFLEILFTEKCRKWVTALHDVTKITEFGRDPDFEALVKRMNRFSAGNFLYCCVATMVYSVNTFMESLKCKKDLNEVCGEFTPTWLLFRDVGLAVSLLIFVPQMILYTLLASSCSISCFLAWEVVEMIISHIKNLKTHFTEMFDESSKEERTKRIRFCVRYHNYILEITDRLNVLIKYSSGVVTILAAISLSCVGNQIFTGKPLGAVSYMLAYLVAVFWICHGGQRISDESFSLKDAVYASKWYDADIADMKDVLFIIARCQIPICLETLPIGILDYPLFLLIVKTTYSYLTLLSQTK